MQPGPDEDTREELAELSSELVGHLDAGRWDEARDGADTLLELAADCGQLSLWREFGLLVDEAAETGYAAAQLEAE